jgi:hypothetical protein
MNEPKKWYDPHQSLQIWKWLAKRKSSSASKYPPHQGDREMARRRGELGWRSRRANILGA